MDNQLWAKRIDFLQSLFRRVYRYPVRVLHANTNTKTEPSILILPAHQSKLLGNNTIRIAIKTWDKTNWFILYRWDCSKQNWTPQETWHAWKLDFAEIAADAIALFVQQEVEAIIKHRKENGYVIT